MIVKDITKGKGGAERVACELANEMIKRGHQVSILCNAEPDSTSSYSLSDEVNLICRTITDHTLLELRAEIKALSPSVLFGFYSMYDLIHQFILTYNLGIPVGFQECTNPMRAINNLAKHPKIADVDQALQIRSVILAGAQGVRMTVPSYLESLPLFSGPWGRAFPNSFKEPKAQSNTVSYTHLTLPTIYSV